MRKTYKKDIYQPVANPSVNNAVLLETNCINNKDIKSLIYCFTKLFYLNSNSYI